MSDQYMREILRVAVAQICQTIGYNATQTAPLELLQDVLDKFMKEFTRDLRRQVEHYNRTEANLNDVNLTLNSINVNLNELLDYINNVEPVPFALEVPKFPARKDSALNFLKPGSKEVLTRPVHVHDYLPPMLPPEITQPPDAPMGFSTSSLTDSKIFADNLPNNAASANTELINNDSTSKSAATVLDKTTLQSLFKPSTSYDDGERPTREVSSVVMTSGGYISPAVEGKMPEAKIPDIIDKLLGLDAPPPPTPPPLPPPPVVVRPPSRATILPPGPVEIAKPANDKDVSDRGEREVLPATLKESKKSLARSIEPQPISNKKLELIHEFHAKKSKLFNSAAKGYPHDAHAQPVGNYNKKSFIMHQNAANMLLKKAKKQKVPMIPGQAGISEKHAKPLSDKTGKMDAADKAHRKYMKMLQKMAKQGKIPPELLSNIMGPDKKSKIINPAIVASMPPGPEKLQLEKLLRKQAKQRQKILKQQMMMEVQKQSKKPIQQPPPLVPIFPPKSSDSLTKPLSSDFDENKLKTEIRDNASISPVKSSFAPNAIASMPSTTHLSSDVSLTKGSKQPALNEAIPVNISDGTTKSLNTKDGKEHKLSNEPDRTKLNIFKKISKQKTPKSSSPTPTRVPGLNDTPMINLPSGTTITPAPGPSNAANSTPALTATPLGRSLFPDGNSGGVSNNLLNADDLKDKSTAPAINPNQPTDLSMLNRVFGEKPAEVELINKPKKRGRKPGSKNSPKVPGVFPNNLLKKNNKKLKMMDSSNIFGPQMPPQLPPEFAAAASMGNLSFESVAQLFGNPLNPMEWAQNKHLQQQMMIMATAKERKEHKKKPKLSKQDHLNTDKAMPNMSNLTNPHMVGPTNEEVQSINKKLMRMDTILKPAPSTAPSDLTVDTSLITGKKLASPSMFPSSTSPLKSPGNTKRLLAATGAETMANSLVQPFMLPNRPAFPNLPTNMLSMLQFPFPTRPGLIPTPGLFPTPGLGAFPTNPKNPLLPGLFPFPNLKHTMGDNSALSQDSENLATDKKKIEMNLQTAERSYCNVAPLVPDFLTKLNEQNSGNKHVHDPPHPYEADLPKTSKSRNSHSAALSQDNLLKKMVEAHAPESAAGSVSGKSIPSTPGGISLNTFEQLMKKCDSPMDLMSLNKHTKPLAGSQELGLDFSINKKPNINANIAGMAGGLSIKTPITLNNEPIEVSDDSDETNQPQHLPPEKKPMHQPSSNASHLSSHQPQLPTHHHHHHHNNNNNNFDMDDMFVANTVANLIPKPLEAEISNKELKKLKKQVKKSALPNINTNLIKTDKTEGLTASTAAAGGVGKLAGGADLIPLTSTGLAYSAKNIPYNSLTANANLSFHSHKTDYSNSAATSAAAAAAPQSSASSVFDNLTITAAIPMNSSSAHTVFDLQKKRKEHKKLKKLKELKEGKIKKKKDKKDKNKNKERAEKYLLSQTTQISPAKEKEKEHVAVKEGTASVLSVHSSGSSGSEKVKDKDLLKKLKKEKKKEKQRPTLEEHAPQNPTATALAAVTSSNAASAHKEKSVQPSGTTSISTFESELPSKKQKLSPAGCFTTPTASEHYETALTISTTSLTAPPSIVPKLTLKLGSTHSPTPPREDGHKTSSATTLPSSTASAPALQAPQTQTTPPREREPSPELARISPLVTRPPKHKLNTSGDLAASSSNTTNTILAANASSLEIGESIKNSATPNSNMIVPPPSPWLSGGTISASSVLLPHQLLQTTKQHDMSATPVSSAHNTDANTKNATTDRQSPLTLIAETSRPSSYIDAEGNRVWICPACGKVDDGSPMIGCDGCDAWYHWVCVGIFVAPKDNEDWFCRVCITRKKGLHGLDKKRKRNKKK